jgi:hypothetical protein
MNREHLQWVLGQVLTRYLREHPHTTGGDLIRARARWLAYSRLPSDEPRPRQDGSLVIPLRQQR